jgi:putative inorganic carbon (hco3(-)) transporter
MNALATARRLPASAWLAPAEGENRLLRSVAPANPRQNWVLFAFVALIPLQNIYSQYIPNIGGGLNFLNLMFAASLVLALNCGGRLVRGHGVNGWAFAFMAVAVIALLVGFNTVDEPEGHVSALKDQLIGMSFLFLAQLSTTDWGGIRRLLLVSFVPLPYMFHVVRDQHASVSRWHYDHDLRVAGTFSELGANEFAAFCVTATLVATALLLTVKLRAGWRAVLVVAAACAVTGVLLTYSRTAYVAVLLGLVLLLVLRRARTKLLIAAFAALLIVPPLLPNAVTQRFESIELAEETRDESTDSRFVFWRIAIDRFADDPLVGTGYHTFHHEEVNPFRMDTHNFFLRELVEKGLLGFVVLAGLLFSIARLLWRGYRSAPSASWSYGLYLALFCAFAALMASNMFGDRFSHYPMIAHFWLYIGLALRAAQLQRDQRQRLRRAAAADADPASPPRPEAGLPAAGVAQ